MTTINEVDQSRRAFLRGGALLVAFALVPVSHRALADTEVDTLGTVVLAPDLPGSLRTNPWLDAWIRVGPDGITVYTGKVNWAPGSKPRYCKLPLNGRRSPRPRPTCSPPTPH